MGDMESRADKDGVIVYCNDPRYIRLEIARARREGRGIDHACARRIATWSAIEKEPSNALYILAYVVEQGRDVVTQNPARSEYRVLCVSRKFLGVRI